MSKSFKCDKRKISGVQFLQLFPYKGGKKRVLGLGYTETCGAIRCHLKHVWCLPLEMFPSFFPVSQWEAWNLFQVTSDGATRFNVTKPLFWYLFQSHATALKALYRCQQSKHWCAESYQFQHPFCVKNPYDNLPRHRPSRLYGLTLDYCQLDFTAMWKVRCLSTRSFLQSKHVISKILVSLFRQFLERY